MDVSDDGGLYATYNPYAEDHAEMVPLPSSTDFKSDEGEAATTTTDAASPLDGRGGDGGGLSRAQRALLNPADPNYRELDDDDDAPPRRKSLATKRRSSLATVAKGLGLDAVIGIEDDRWGERVSAFIEPATDGVSPKKLDTYCLESGLARFKRPRAYAFVKAIPRSASGKLLRRHLRTGDFVLLTDYENTI